MTNKQSFIRGATTRFASLRPRTAWFLLAAFALFLLASINTPVIHTGSGQEASADKGDRALYAAIVSRVRAGEPYYDAVGTELRARGYAVSPFPNWRLPATAWMISAFENDRTAHSLLLALSAATVFAWMLKLRAYGHARQVSGTLLAASGLFLFTASNTLYFHEAWAALLLSLSLALYDPRRWYPSVCLGVLAMLFRELAIIYAFAMLTIALFERRRGEAFGWIAGIALFATVLALHAHIVNDLILETDRAKTWLHGGGWGFVLATTKWAMLGGVLPDLFFQIIAPLTLLGALAWPNPLGARIAAILAAYFLAYMIAGNPDNNYWGWLFAGIFPLGLLHAGPALRDLARTAFPKTLSKGN